MIADDTDVVIATIENVQGNVLNSRHRIFDYSSRTFCGLKVMTSWKRTNVHAAVKLCGTCEAVEDTLVELVEGMDGSIEDAYNE